MPDARNKCAVFVALFTDHRLPIILCGPVGNVVGLVCVCLCVCGR